MDNYDVSICTFAVNEVESLQICVQTILARCDNSDIKEIIFCTCKKTLDESLRTISRLQKQYPDILIRTVEQPPESKYWGEACRTLFRTATGSHILSMSSDLECNPEYVADLIEKSKQNPDMLIKASRWIEGSVFKGYGTFRKIGNKVFQFFMIILFGKEITDYTYSFQIAPARVFKETYFHKNGRTVAVELIAGPIMRGIKVKEIPIVWRKREESHEKKRIIKDITHLFWYFIIAIDIRFRLKR